MGQWGDLIALPSSRPWEGQGRGAASLPSAPTLYPFFSLLTPFLLGDQEPGQVWREQRRLSSASATGQWSPAPEWVRVWARGTQMRAGSGAPRLSNSPVKGMCPNPRTGLGAGLRASPSGGDLGLSLARLLALSTAGLSCSHFLNKLAFPASFPESLAQSLMYFLRAQLTCMGITNVPT